MHCLHQYTNEQLAMFQNCIGRPCLKIYNGFKFSPEDDRADLATVLAKFDERFVGKINESYERHIFNQRARGR